MLLDRRFVTLPSGAMQQPSYVSFSINVMCGMATSQLVAIFLSLSLRAKCIAHPPALRIHGLVFGWSFVLYIAHLIADYFQNRIQNLFLLRWLARLSSFCGSVIKPNLQPPWPHLRQICLLLPAACWHEKYIENCNWKTWKEKTLNIRRLLKEIRYEKMA